jgi:perosamine synthetase
MAEDSFISYFKPSIGEEEERDVLACLRSGWLTTGKYAKEFEKSFAEFIGVEHAVAVNSCTAALHLALDAVGVERGDLVIVPTLTFTSTAEVVRYFDAIPVMVDSNEDDFCLDIEALRRALEAIRGERRSVKAVIPVHYAGSVADVDALEDLKKEFGFHLVEDCAHALPAWRKTRSGKRITAGSTADIACFSFYANKTITTGEGGMLVTGNGEWADRARVMSLHGISKDAWKRYSKAGSWRYEVIAPGYKYNMPDLAAAVGVNQLKKARAFRDARAAVAAGYAERLKDIPGLRLPETPDGVESSWHLYVVRIDAGKSGIHRDDFIERMREEGVGTSVHFIPLHLQPYYRDAFGYRQGDFPVAERLFDEIVSLPIYPSLSESDLDRIAEAIRKVVPAAR